MAKNKAGDQHATAETHDHANIPRDPFFFIVPPATQYDQEVCYRWLAACRVGWEATKDPAALMEALLVTHDYRQPLQPWLVEAACRVMTKGRTKGFVTRRRNAIIRWTRYIFVCIAKQGLTWDAAYLRAAEQSAKIPGVAASARTMKASYDQVVRDLKTGRAPWYHFMPKVPKFGRTRAPTT